MCEILNQQIERYKSNTKYKWTVISKSLEILKGMEKRIKLVKQMRKTLSINNISTYLVDREIKSLKEKITFTLGNTQHTRKLRKEEFLMIKHLEVSKFIADSEETQL